MTLILAVFVGQPAVGDRIAATMNVLDKTCKPISANLVEPMVSSMVAVWDGATQVMLDLVDFTAVVYRPQW